MRFCNALLFDSDSFILKCGCDCEGGVLKVVVWFWIFYHYLLCTFDTNDRRSVVVWFWTSYLCPRLLWTRFWRRCVEVWFVFWSFWVVDWFWFVYPYLLMRRCIEVWFVFLNLWVVVWFYLFFNSLSADAILKAVRCLILSFPCLLPTANAMWFVIWFWILFFFFSQILFRCDAVLKAVLLFDF